MSKTVNPTNPAEDNVNRLECQTCPYQYLLEKRYFERKTFVRQEREDVFGGAESWDNAEKSKTQCPNDGCNGEEAAFFQVQIRSADEPMTTFYKVSYTGALAGVGGGEEEGVSRRRNTNWM